MQSIAWWLEGATSRHFGWVQNPSEAIFSYFLSQGNLWKISDFFVFLLIFFFRFFFVKIVSMPLENRFFADKSVEKSDFFFTMSTAVRREERESGVTD